MSIKPAAAQMQKMRILNIAVFALSLCFSDFALARDINRTARSGERTKMWAYHSWNKECKTNTGIVKVVSKPHHGTISNQLINSRVTKGHYGNPVTKCFGAAIKAFQVDYKSAPRFRGVDTFTLDVTWGTKKREIDNFTVDVR